MIPDHIHPPGIFFKRHRGRHRHNRIEFRTPPRSDKVGCGGIHPGRSEGLDPPIKWPRPRVSAKELAGDGYYLS